ncbi:MAG: bifunctional 3-deoxy-7-phosphoheptulonate synthase/chorismate mutase type II [Paludibacteraceae bacterium]|nr:bifunctional 3-deoxy-7-phosphoheptulonate synthase/chorismate mutase type II [Paludibacteraceae bacterium]
MLIIGPCSAESQQQLIDIAGAFADSEIISSSAPFSKIIFRAGLWKPRTSPSSFQGVGENGLPWLMKVSQSFGFPVATEVATPEQMNLAVQAGIDYLWIGARTSADPIAVQALANMVQQLQSSVRRQLTVLIKNPTNTDTALWLGNIRRLQAAGASVQAIHRGCNHRPCWEMAYRLRQEMPDVPLLLDPSHMSGQADLVPGLSHVALQLGLDGLMIEVHNQPDCALSDAKQQLTPAQLSSLLSVLAQDFPDRTHTARPDDLAWLRLMMDEVDDDLWNVYLRRMEVSRAIGAYKRQHNMKVVQPARFNEVLTRRLAWAKDHNLDPVIVETILHQIHTESIRMQS